MPGPGGRAMPGGGAPGGRAPGGGMPAPGGRGTPGPGGTPGRAPGGGAGRAPGGTAPATGAGAGAAGAGCGAAGRTCVAADAGIVLDFWPTSAFTLSSSTWLSKGLVTWSSARAARARFSSKASKVPASSTTGMPWVAGSLFSASQTS
ncbi:hypothetical protein MYMAC_004377 [Corallococcus macrosporus DSM 14697]|uniref:Uncharacterized protein n=1 Tax=Corallococcus macrosporus DSM 14697 TaxID=1189310 RepID=A0A250JZ20_9BACT|nr:hypothetical protein MYMAC_004377 [Corallococcus macrosporus DSM 14697]